MKTCAQNQTSFDEVCLNAEAGQTIVLVQLEFVVNVEQQMSLQLQHGKVFTLQFCKASMRPEM